MRDRHLSGAGSNLSSLCFWTAVPFLLPQALVVRSRAPRLAAAGGAAEGVVGSGPELSLVGIGDSIIAGVGVTLHADGMVGRTAASLASSLSRRVAWRSIGKIGADSGRLLETLLPRLPANPVDCVVISIGVNDVTSLARSGSWQRNLEKILSRLLEHSPNALIAVAGIPPLAGFPLLPWPLRHVIGRRGEQFDALACSLVKRVPHAGHVPLDFTPKPDMFSPDGYHPSAESYKTFGKAMADKLAEMWNARLHQHKKNDASRE